MPRPLIGPQPTGEMPHEGVAHPKPASAPLPARLRERRSPAYVAAIARLDSGAHTIDRAALDAAVAAIVREFPELTLDQRPLGLVAKCGLGETFEVHVLDVPAASAAHVRAGEALPGSLERARTLALHPAYVFVEVFPGAMHAVRADGSVTVVAFA